MTMQVPYQGLCSCKNLLLIRVNVKIGIILFESKVISKLPPVLIRLVLEIIKFMSSFEVLITSATGNPTTDRTKCLMSGCLT